MNIFLSDLIAFLLKWIKIRKDFFFLPTTQINKALVNYSRIVCFFNVFMKVCFALHLSFRQGERINLYQPSEVSSRVQLKTNNTRVKLY